MKKKKDLKMIWKKLKDNREKISFIILQPTSTLKFLLGSFQLTGSKITRFILCFPLVLKATNYSFFVKSYINSKHQGLDPPIPNSHLQQYFLFIPFYALQTHQKLRSAVEYQTGALAYNCLTSFLFLRDISSLMRVNLYLLSIYL